jgi:Spy/CpxP family protein refolding chaperone
MVSRRFRGAIVLGLVFALGAGTGGAVAFAIVRSGHARVMAEGGAFEQHRAHGLARRLDLDAAQEEKVRAILAKDGVDSRGLYKDMLERCGQPLREQKERADAEIRALLRPDQQQKFDALLAERRERPWAPGPGGPGGPGPGGRGGGPR